MATGSPVLTEIRSHGRGSKRRTFVVDGEPWRCVPAAVVKELGVRVGDSIDVTDLEQQIAEVAPRLARERALRLLAVRERTVAELSKRLLEDGYGERVVRDTVEALRSTGLVDDRRFAENVARSLIVSRGLGRSRALREMTRKGLADDMAVAALDEYAAADGEPLRALEVAGRLSKEGDTVQRLAARLARRGFAPGVALSAARQIVDTAMDDSDFDGC